MPFDLKTKNKGTEIEEHEELSLSYSEKTYYDAYFQQWNAPEHEPYTVGKRFYFFSTIILAAIVVYALISNSPIMAITFILIGVVGYVFLQKEPKLINFKISSQGVTTDQEIYEFENLKSFWIFYEPPYEKMLSLESKNKMMPHINIPLGNEDPVKIRQILIDFIPEVKQEHNIVDIAERLLHR
jgi:hypothetical protein